MRVAVVVPVLNEVAIMQNCLTHLQAHAFDEVIVVDGGSTDGTVAIVAADPHVSLLQTEPGRGLQIQRGIEATSAEAIVVLHCDTRLPNDARAIIEQTLLRHHAGAFVTRHVAQQWQWPHAWLLRLADFRSRYSPLPYGDQAMFFTRLVWQKVGGFPLQPLMEDLEFSKRLRRVGPIFRCRPPVSVSGRRFESAALYQTFLVNAFPFLYQLGVSPQRLARWYGHPR